MKIKDISIKSLEVDIHVVRIGGAKMTLSVFDQIPVPKYIIEDDKWLGYVRRRGTSWVLLARNGELLKAERSALEECCAEWLKDEHTNLNQLYVAT